MHDIGPFDEKNKSWDRYKRFYVMDSIFVRFDNNEIIVPFNSIAVGYREKYNCLVANPSELKSSYGKLHCDEFGKIPLSWCAPRGKILYDYDNKTALRIDLPLQDKPYLCYAYWASPTSKPQGGPFYLRRGIATAPGEVKRWINDVVALAKIEVEIVNPEKYKIIYVDHTPAVINYKHGVEPMEYLNNPSVVKRLALNGYAPYYYHEVTEVRIV